MSEAQQERRNPRDTMVERQQFHSKGNHSHEDNDGNYHLYNGRPRFFINLIINPDLFFLPLPPMLPFVGRFHNAYFGICLPFQ